MVALGGVVEQDLRLRVEPFDHSGDVLWRAELGAAKLVLDDLLRGTRDKDGARLGLDSYKVFSQILDSGFWRSEGGAHAVGGLSFAQEQLGACRGDFVCKMSSQLILTRTLIE